MGLHLPKTVTMALKMRLLLIRDKVVQSCFRVICQVQKEPLCSWINGPCFKAMTVVVAMVTVVRMT